MKRFIKLAFPLCLAMAASAQAQDTGTSRVDQSPAGTSGPLRHFEISGSLFFLQPGSGNLEYATLVNPFPLPTPNWSNQSLSPNFSPALHFGLRYIPSELTDIQGTSKNSPRYRRVRVSGLTG